MNRQNVVVLVCSVALLAAPELAAAQDGKAPERPPSPGESPAPVRPGSPQDVVVCTGWHALCSASRDCRVNGQEADCDCMRVDEPHLVLTSEIQDVRVRRLTQRQCTVDHPCRVDEAPVCGAIASDSYRVDGATYDWVSTYSYRGWCSILQPPPVECDPGEPGYQGDRLWAVCDGAPCTENPRPSDPERPLTCRCRVEDAPFVGFGGTCSGQDGGIQSSSPASLWDFDDQTYPVPVPGYEWVRSACAPVESDAPPRPR